MRRLLLLLLSPLLIAAASGGGPVDDATLAQRLAAIDKEIADEQKALTDAQAAWKQALEEKVKQRASLGRKLFDLETERQSLDTRRAALIKQDQQLRTDASVRCAAVETLRNAAIGMADQLSVHLAEIPGSDAAAQQLTSMVKSLRTSPAALPDALRVLPVIIDQVHGEASHIRVQPATIFDAAGQQADLSLLTAGHIAFAYQSKTGELALALRSPADATGYRWSTRLPQSVREQLHEAFTAAGSPTASTVLLPIDVTSRVRADSLATHESLLDVIRAGGPVMIPIGCVGLIALLLVLERLLTLYVRNAAHPALVRRILASARTGDYGDAERLASTGRGAVARVLAACLRRRSLGQHAMEDSIQEQLLFETPRLQRSLGGLSMLAAASPLLGLLGTVTGIIQTFAVVKTFGNTNPGYMAGGISEALVCTAAGLIVAIPTLLIASLLRGRVERIITDAERNAAALLNILAHDRRTDLTAETQEVKA